MARQLYPQPDPQLSGILFLLTAFGIWGLAPLYWKMLAPIPAFDIILFRIFWSLLCVLPFFIRGRLSSCHRSVALVKAFQLRTLVWMLLPAVLLGGNWLIYVWAVNNGHVLETSLGYYINPLVNVLLGAVFLKEKLRRLQKLAVVLAGLGVVFYIVIAGVPLWIALGLAFSFGCYGLLRKTSPLGAIDGFMLEMLLLSFLALPLLVYRNHVAGLYHDWDYRFYLLLAGTGPLTALPMVTFAVGARKVPMHTVGFMQYLAPSGTFLLGLFHFHETFHRTMMVTFVFIWTALAVFTLDLLQHSARAKNTP